jgi:hypothetical protein
MRLKRRIGEKGFCSAEAFRKRNDLYFLEHAQGRFLV